MVTAFNRFGDSVSLDGDALIVGAPGTIAISQLVAGSAYIFERDISNNFVEQIELLGSDQGATDRLGRCVSVNDGVAVVYQKRIAMPDRVGPRIEDRSLTITAVCHASSFDKTVVNSQRS